MIRLYLMVCFLMLSGCGGQSVSKPTLLSNAESYSNDAMQAYQDEEWVSAQRLFNRALYLYQSMDDRQAVLASHINLVEVALARHDPVAAQKRLRLAEDIVIIDGLDDFYLRMSLLNALVAMQQKETTKANGFLSKLLPVFKDVAVLTTPDRIQLVAISSRVNIAFERKQHESLWVQRYFQALKKSANQDSALEAGLLRFQSKLLLQQGAYNEAETYLQQALMIYKNKGSRTGTAGVLLALGELYKKQAKNVQALSHFKRSMFVYRSLGSDRKVNEVIELLKQMKLKVTKQ